MLQKGDTVWLVRFPKDGVAYFYFVKVLETETDFPEFVSIETIRKIYDSRNLSMIDETAAYNARRDQLYSPKTFMKNNSHIFVRWVFGPGLENSKKW